MSLSPERLAELKRIADEYAEHSMPSAIAFKQALAVPELIAAYEDSREVISEINTEFRKCIKENKRLKAALEKCKEQRAYEAHCNLEYATHEDVRAEIRLMDAEIDAVLRGNKN